ncbi:MAG: hypothetical protein ACRDQ0_20765, partial [Pseudonocardia sp.]
LYGSNDLQVPAAQNELSMQALLSGKRDVVIRTFPGLNHHMQPSDTGGPDESGTIDTTIDPGLLNFIKSWVTQRFPT